MSALTANHSNSDEDRSSSLPVSDEFDPAQLAAITSDDIAAAILKSTYSERKQIVLNNLDSGSKIIHGKIYPLPINWGTIGTKRSHHENLLKWIQHIADSVYNLNEQDNSRSYITCHEHFLIPEKDFKDWPLVQEMVPKFGYEIAHTLATVDDLFVAYNSFADNNTLSQIYLRKDVNATQDGVIIVAVGLDGKVLCMGMLDLLSLEDDEPSFKIVFDLLKKKYDTEKKGEEFVPYVDEYMAVLEAVRKHTLINEMPDWIDQNSNLTFTDEGLTSMGGPDKIIGIFQDEEDQLPGHKWVAESAMLCISTQNWDKIDTIVKPLRPRITIPNAWRKLKGVTTPGIPVIKLGADELTRELFLDIRSNREIEIPEEELFKTVQAFVSEKEFCFVDKGWEHYLPKQLLQEAIKER